MMPAVPVDDKNGLKDRADPLAGIFSIFPAGIVLVRNRTILRVNDRFCAISGYAQEELIGKDTRFLYLTEEDYLRVGQVQQPGGNQYGFRAVETQWKRKDGQIRTIMLSGTPAEPQDPGKAWIVVVFDITDTKKAEEDLRLLKISVDRAYDEIFWIDFEGNILYVNEAACRITGYTPEELRAMKVYELDPDFPPSVWALSVADLRTRKSQFIITRHRCKDGRILDVEIATVYVERNGREYSFAYVRVISDRIWMEEELACQHRQLESFMQNIPVGVFRITYGQKSKWVMVNPLVARMFGYASGDQFKLVPPAELFPDNQAWPGILARLSMNGAMSDTEIQLKKKSGDLFWASLSAVVVPGPGGSPEFIDGILTDITAAKRSRSALSEANRKFKLLNSMTRHDILNQLTGLKGYVELASAKSPDPPIGGYLEKIASAAETITRQVEFTKAYQELGINVPAWLNLADVIERTASSVPVTLDKTCRGIEVFADPMLELVFFNLFDNSLRHGKRVTGIGIRCEREPDLLRVVVEDDGVGISAEDKGKIFRRGYGHNTGLGLFLVREILAITGMRIQENGTPGKGARFEICIPRDAFRAIP